MKSKIYKKCKDATVNSDNVMKNGLLIGCHHGLTNRDIIYMLSKFDSFLLNLNFNLLSSLFLTNKFICNK